METKLRQMEKKQRQNGDKAETKLSLNWGQAETKLKLNICN